MMYTQMYADVAVHLRVLMLLSLYVPFRIASSINCIFFKLSSPSAWGGRKGNFNYLLPLLQNPTQAAFNFNLLTMSISCSLVSKCSSYWD